MIVSKFVFSGQKQFDPGTNKFKMQFKSQQGCA